MRDSRRIEFIRKAVNEHQHSLTRYAAGMLRDIHAARDAVQETFLRLCSADLIKIRPYLNQWLFKVCRSRVMDIVKREKKMKNIDPGEIGKQSTSCPVAERNEPDTTIMKIIKELPPAQQEVIRLKFQEGLKYREISRITDKTVSNVGFLIHAALKTIRSRVRQFPQGGAE